MFGMWLFYMVDELCLKRGIFHMVDGLCSVRGYSTWWTSCVWYVVIIQGGCVVFGMWLLYKVDMLCLVCGYYTRWICCVWYVVILHGGRVVFGMCRFTIVGSHC